MGYRCRTKMHRALELPELVRHIAGFLDHRSLAALARTCKNISELAYEALYREVDKSGLISLMQTLSRAPLVTKKIWTYEWEEGTPIEVRWVMNVSEKHSSFSDTHSESMY